MRRFVPIVVLVAATVAGAAAYTVYAGEREYERLIAAGDDALAQGMPFQALEAYSGAIARRPDSMLAHLKRGMVYRERGESEAALRDLLRAVSLDPTAPRALEQLGDAQLDLQRFERAAERYEQYLAVDDGNARVLYKLGLARYRHGRTAAAREALHEAVRLDKTMAEAHLLMGLCLRDAGDLAAARAAFETAARLSPALTAPREALAGLHVARGDMPRAIDQLEALAALEPARPERVVAVGLAHARAGRHEAAVLALGRVIERFPDVPHGYAALGRIWLQAAERRGDRAALGKAIEALSAASSHPDVSSEVLADLGQALLLRGDLPGAERALRQAISRLPVPPEAFVRLATIAGREGRLQEARDALIRYATLVGDTQPLAAVAMDIARHSVSLGDPGAAVRWIERAVAQDGPSVGLLTRLAEIHWRAGDLAGARQAVRRGLALDPGDRALLALSRRLPS